MKLMMIKEKGFSFVENWCRVIKDTGSFRFKKAENVDLLYEWFPGYPKMDEGYKTYISKCGDSYLETQTFMDKTFILTKIPGGSKWVVKDKNGGALEGTTIF